MIRAVDALLDGAERAFLGVANTLLLAMLAINVVNILSRLVRDVAFVWVFPGRACCSPGRCSWASTWSTGAVRTSASTS